VRRSPTGGLAPGAGAELLSERDVNFNADMSTVWIFRELYKGWCAAAKRLGKSKAVVDYKEFAGRPHFTSGAPGWEAVADYALDWANRHVAAPVEHRS
jgi:hypothetical protein